MEGRTPFGWRWFWIIAAGAGILCLVQHPALGWQLLRWVGKAFLPFGIGLSVAFLLNVPLCFLEERVFAGKKYSRGWTLSLTCLLTAGLIGVLLFFILPQLQRSSAQLITDFPIYLSRLENWASENAQKLGPQASRLADGAGKSVEEWLQGLEDSSNMLQSTVSAAAGLFQGAANLLAGIVFSVYLLARKEALCYSCKRVLFAFLPREKAACLCDIGKLTALTFRKFVSGQLIEALLLGILCFLGMALFRFPYALLISVIIGVTALIPIFGAFLGTGVSALILLTEKPVLALWFILFIVVLQQFESNFLYPRVVGDSIGLPGVWVLLAVTAGGSAFGIVGMLAGIPLASVGYTLFREFVARRLRERKITRRDLEH